MSDTIEAGDRVRSFDFAWRQGGRDLAGPRACYVEGEVVRLLPVGERFAFDAHGETAEAHFPDCTRYVVRVERRIFRGEPCEPSGPYVFPPTNGTPTILGETCRGVERIDPDQDKLRAAFDLVADPVDWKGPIDAVVTDDELEAFDLTADDVRDAVVHYTAVVPYVQKARNGLLVRCIGYRQGPAGDR